MCVCMCTQNRCVYMHVRVCAHVYILIICDMPVYICTRVYTHTYMHVYFIYTCMCTHHMHMCQCNSYHRRRFSVWSWEGDFLVRSQSL